MHTMVVNEAASTWHNVNQLSTDNTAKYSRTCTILSTFEITSTRILICSCLFSIHFKWSSASHTTSSLFHHCWQRFNKPWIKTKVFRI